MKMKYRVSDDEIICIGSMPELSANVGEAIEDFLGVIPIEPIVFYKRSSPGRISKKIPSDISAIVDSEKKPVENDLKNKIANMSDKEKLNALTEIVFRMAHKLLNNKDIEDIL